jgi:hypothetical protein
LCLLFTVTPVTMLLQLSMVVWCNSCAGIGAARLLQRLQIPEPVPATVIVGEAYLLLLSLRWPQLRMLLCNSCAGCQLAAVQQWLPRAAHVLPPAGSYGGMLATYHSHTCLLLPLLGPDCSVKKALLRTM